jgi:hypothetical protein
MSHPAHPSSLHNSNYKWRRAKIKQFLGLQFSSPSRHFIPLRYKYFPQYPALKYHRALERHDFAVLVGLHTVQLVLPIITHIFRITGNGKLDYNLMIVLFLIHNKTTNKQTPWPLVRERTIPTDRPPLVDEI